MTEPYMMKRFNKDISKAQSDRLANSFQSKIDSQSSLTDDFNMNDGYLLSLLRLIEEYSLIKIHGIGGVGKDNSDYYYQLWEVLWGMSELLDCKFNDIQREEINKDMMNLLDEIETIFQGSTGQMYMDKRKSMGCRIRLSILFKKLLQIMQSKGMLTKVKDDPRLAMSECD